MGLASRSFPFKAISRKLIKKSKCKTNPGFRSVFLIFNFAFLINYTIAIKKPR